MRELPVIAIRSVDFGVPDLRSAEAFYRDVWGLSVATRTDESLYLRATGSDHHVLALRPHAEPEILSVSFRVRHQDVLDEIAERVTAAHGSIVASAQLSSEPDGGLVLTVATPEGYVLRFHADDQLHADPTAVRSLPLRLSHVNLNCRDIEATSRFFQEALGFVLTDRSKAMAFLRCNSDHHAVVLADSGLDGLNHVAFMMAEWDSVMRGSGRMVDHGFPIGWGVGRHGPGDNVFAYFVDPFGFVVEYTAEVLQVDDTYAAHGPDYWVWPPGRTDHWGIAPPKPEYVKSAQLAIRFANPAAWVSRR
jgi:catechol 2,3-dioxygenase-like lactoylglutathione lyase family enzyme